MMVFTRTIQQVTRLAIPRWWHTPRRIDSARASKAWPYRLWLFCQVGGGRIRLDVYEGCAVAASLLLRACPGLDESNSWKGRVESVSDARGRIAVESE